MKSPKVDPMITSGGNSAADQFLIYTNKGVYFQSYSVIIAFKPNTGKIQLDKNYWDDSATTGNYRNKFLGEGIAETRQGIKDKTYLLRDLNTD